MGTVFKLDPDLEQRFAALAAATGRGAEDQIREAILRGLEDLEDLAEAESISERVARGEEPVYPLEDVRRRLGLGD